VRRAIEDHSSDSENYRTGRLDLFYSVGGIRSGRWGLRSADASVVDQNEVLDGAEAFIETEEGRAILRLHLTRERSRTLILRFLAGTLP
jgi:hypothetical protein